MSLNKIPVSIWFQLGIILLESFAYGSSLSHRILEPLDENELSRIILDSFHFIVHVILLLAIFKRWKEVFIFPLFVKLIVAFFTIFWLFNFHLIVLIMLFYHPDTQTYYDRKIENIDMEEHLVD